MQEPCQEDHSSTLANTKRPLVSLMLTLGPPSASERVTSLGLHMAANALRLQSEQRPEQPWQLLASPLPVYMGQASSKPESAFTEQLLLFPACGKLPWGSLFLPPLSN